MGTSAVAAAPLERPYWRDLYIDLLSNTHLLRFQRIFPQATGRDSNVDFEARLQALGVMQIDQAEERYQKAGRAFMRGLASASPHWSERNIEGVLGLERNFLRIPGKR